MLSNIRSSNRCIKSFIYNFMTVAKFGGSSLDGADRTAKAVDIVKKRKFDCVVVSAPGGKPKVTDLLISAYFEWVNSGDCGKYFDIVADRFEKIARPLGLDITNLLTFVRGEINAGRSYDYVVSRGEFVMAKIMAKLTGYDFCDATNVIKISGVADAESTEAHVRTAKFPCVVPGFYGKEPNGAVRLLPRGGSDVTGALIASSLDAMYEKFTDVCGIFDGYGGVIDRINYSDAKILTYYGASVLRYESVDFLAEKNCVMRITDGLARGTVICGDAETPNAKSSRKMYFSRGESCRHVTEIIDKGLKIPLVVNSFNKKLMLIDDNDFSEKAVERILKYGDTKRVSVTAYLGKCNDKYDFDMGDYKLRIDDVP